MDFSTKPRPEEKIFQDLEALCVTPGFVHVLAALCFRDNIWRYGAELTAADLAKSSSKKQLIRTEIATLTGLMIKRPVDFSHPGARAIQTMIDAAEALLEELHLSMMQPWFKAMEEIAKSGRQDIDPFQSAAGMREPIFYGGDSAYDFQYLTLAERKYGNDEEWLRTTRGFGISDAVKVSRFLQSRLTTKLGGILAGLRGTHPNGWTMLPGFVFSAEEVSSATGLEGDVVAAVLNAFIDDAEFPNTGFQAVGDFNTANSHPVIRAPNGQFLLLQTYSLLEAVYESPFYWMIADRAYRSTATASRGRFTETFAAERLSAVFGTENVIPNVRLLGAGGLVKGEIDVLVRYGTRVLLVQAKSKKLTIAARKGNDAAMKVDFAGAVQDAYDQAQDCAVLILDPGISLVNDAGAMVTRPKATEVIVPICIVSDHYPALASQARQFLVHKETDKLIAPLVMDIFLLDVLCELLSSPLHLLSYLERRSGYNEKLVATQELTVLGYHLRSNLWLDAKFDMVSMDESMSADVDVAMMARRAGIPGRTVPKGILTEQRKGTIGDIIKDLEQSDEPAKFDLGMMLLQLSGRTLEHLSKGIELAARLARSDKKVHDFSMSIAEGATGITVHATSEPAVVAGPALSGHCERRKYVCKAETWFGVAIDPITLKPRAGMELRGDWERSEAMDRETAGMRPDPGLAGPPTDDRKSFEELVRPLGRNDKCWCGSGRKYKHCHLDSDNVSKWRRRS